MAQTADGCDEGHTRGILSYAGKVIVGVRVDEAVTKNPGRFVELFEEEVSSMLEKANS